VAVDDREVARKVERALGARPIEPIAELAGTRLACIAGVVEAADGLPVAPVAGVACVMWDAAVHRRRYPFHEVEGETAHRVRGAVPFAIVDAGGGRAVIEPDEALLSFARARIAMTRPGSRVARELLAGAPGGVTTGEEWVEEGVIVPGDEVVVIGVATREVDPGGAVGGYRDQVATRVRVRGTADAPVIISHRSAGARTTAPVVPEESAIAELVPGMWAIVTGIVERAGAASPVTGRACAAWSIVPHGAPYAVRSPQPAIASGTPFWLEHPNDRSVRVLIDPVGAELRGFGVESRVAPFAPEVAAILAAHGAAGARWIEEAVVPLRGGVFVEGLVLADPDDDEDGGRPRLRMVGTRERPLVIR
jgi:hypothetical protein